MSSAEKVMTSAEIRAWFEDYKDNLRREGFDQGRDKGRDEGQRAMLVRQLRVRFGEVPPSIIARIETAEQTQIEQWGDRFVSARTLVDVFNDAS